MSAHFESSHYASSHNAASHWGRGLILTITPKGGITDDILLRLKKRNKKARRNVRNLLSLVTIFIAIEEGDDE